MTWTKPQWEAFNANDYGEKVYFGGYGSGKSKWLIWQTLFYCTQYPGNNWLYCRATYPEFEGTTIPDFFKECPPEWIIKYNKQKRQLILRTKGAPSIITFKALDDPGKIESFNLGGVSIDQIETVPFQIVLRLKGRIRLNSVPKRYLLGAGNPADNWCKIRYSDTSVPLSKYASETTISYKDLEGKTAVTPLFNKEVKIK